VKVTKDWHVTKQGSSDAPVHRIDVDHGVRDGKDRRVGGRATITDRGGPTLGEGADRFDLEIIGTRDGLVFGPSRPSSYFSDLALAKEGAIGRLERQGKGFRKTYGGRS
jgi:hypothetical protein